MKYTILISSLLSALSFGSMSGFLTTATRYAVHVKPPLTFSRNASTRTAIREKRTLRGLPPEIIESFKKTMHDHGFDPALLEEVEKQLSEIPGFEKVVNDSVRTCQMPHFLKGLFQEWVTALFLKNICNHELCYFHHNLYNPLAATRKDKREIDIITRQKTAHGSIDWAVECKHYRWTPFNSDRVRRIKLLNQLEAQLRILDINNNYTGTHYKHLFCSKNSIPDWLKEWLSDHGSTYISLDDMQLPEGVIGMHSAQA